MNLINFYFQHIVIAAIIVAIYTLMCAATGRAQLIKRRHTMQLRGSTITHTMASLWRVVYASQTGTAEELARQTAATLHLVGIPVHLCALNALNADTLQRAERILFIVSTYGEGNPPDNAALFAKHIMGAQRVMSTALPLGQLHYALLALGDRSYAHFCGFGREIDQWLQVQGAQPMFPSIEVHQCDPDATAIWLRQISHLAGTDDAPDWQGPIYDQWQLAARTLLNPGSQGNEIFHLELKPAAGTALPHWESGDLVQIRVSSDTSRPREYSIASIPNDGCIHLLVRLHRHPDGNFGTASGWLTQTAPIGAAVPLRLRRHERFHLGDNAARPLLLIGNGSGIAGLRGHLKARASGNHRNWLIFGERNAQHDYHYRAEIEAWQRAGVLEKIDAVFSRDQPERRYVQDRLLEAGDAVRDWVAHGAAIYVCGSLNGMASGVDVALTSILGHEALEALSLSGRYRRDVY